jgi:hypothetical protein
MILLVQNNPSFNCNVVQAPAVFHDSIPQHSTVCRNEAQRSVPTASCLQLIIIQNIAVSTNSASYHIMGYEKNKMIHTSVGNSLSALNVLTSVCFVIA